MSKILGRYNIFNDSIGLSSDLDEGEVDRVLSHELTHKWQRDNGAVYRANMLFSPEKARKYIEGAASYINEKVTGVKDCYQKWKRWFKENFVDKYGERNAVLCYV